MSTRFSLSMEMSRLTRDGSAEPVSRDQILRYEWGQGKINLPCSADHEQDWQLRPVDPYSAIYIYVTALHPYINTSIYPYIHTQHYFSCAMVANHALLVVSTSA